MWERIEVRGCTLFPAFSHLGKMGCGRPAKKCRAQRYPGGGFLTNPPIESPSRWGVECRAIGLNQVTISKSVLRVLWDSENGKSTGKISAGVAPPRFLEEF